jgi:hypothetical protein
VGVDTVRCLDGEREARSFGSLIPFVF